MALHVQLLKEKKGLVYCPEYIRKFSGQNPSGMGLNSGQIRSDLFNIPVPDSFQYGKSEQRDPFELITAPFIIPGE
jgi:hypothetical protein